MKWTVLFCMFVGGLSVGAGTAPTVSDVRAQQRWPWNALVDIDYTLGGDTTGLDVDISVTDRMTGKTYHPVWLSEIPPTTAGKHRVTWDTYKDGISTSTDMVATVTCRRIPLARYLVIDLSGGVEATSYPVTTFSDLPVGGWADEYKTTKLVLRRIEAGTFKMGTNGVLTTISKPFYLGVFEVTQKQYQLVMGTNAPSIPQDCTGDMRPVEYCGYDLIRGANAGDEWPRRAIVDHTSFMGRLRLKTGMNGFDLPTEAEWEYACRAGTTSLFNNGGDTENDMNVVGRYYGNRTDGRGGTGGLAIVGSYQPNVWGLYDMHGNAWEFCRDRFEKELSGGTNPVGPLSSDDKDINLKSGRVIRGGGYTGSELPQSGLGNEIPSATAEMFARPGHKVCTSCFRCASILKCYRTEANNSSGGYRWVREFRQTAGFRLFCSIGQ